ncbi:hypothetical protein EXS53_00915, partial [Patescibacteria group bacterium]|nr:hypothetical protein [Patescibacteria group bacterium]
MPKKSTTSKRSNTSRSSKKRPQWQLPLLAVLVAATVGFGIFIVFFSKAGASAGSHSCVAKTDGTVWCWGDNSQGQLGTGNTTKSLIPVKVNITGVASVSAGAGGAHSCATKTDGTVWCWGYNGQGQLGTGNTTNSLIPKVVPYFVGVASVSVGTGHSCATKTDGTLWCWGDNEWGQLGTGNTTKSLIPKVIPYFVKVASVSAGGNHSCATKTDGTLWCWGDNEWGQLGTGNTTKSLIP